MKRRIIIGLVLVAVVGCGNVGAGDSEGGAAKKKKKRGWTDVAEQVAGGVFLGPEHGVVFYGFDVLAKPDEEVRLAARLRTGRLIGEIEDATVGFFYEDELLGEVVSDDEGWAVLSWDPNGVGDYELEARILKAPEDEDEDMVEASPAPLFVRVRKADARFVVIDLDHTLVDSSFARVLVGGGTPMADSQRVTKRIAKKYDIIYLTHRPDVMTHTSKSWLREHKYPPGPLLVSKLSQAIGSSEKFKAAKLASVLKEFANVEIGIGDKLGDATAYAKNGLQAYLIPHYDDGDDDDMRDMAKDLRRLPQEAKIQVVNGWRQVEAGMFKEKRFTAEKFAEWLDGEAAKIEKDDDDDDDDDEDDDDD